jgi:glycosyltransferase involved in cell wall biosynthesis
MGEYRLCIAKPNKSTYSETFIQAHIDKLANPKQIIFGGAFPLYGENGKRLISSKIDLLNYLVQKRLLKRLKIKLRTKALSGYLRREKVTVVLAEYGYVGAMICDACKEANVPLIIHFHGADAHHYATVNKYRSLYADAFQYASKIVVVSKDMMNSVIGLGADEAKMVFNPYGVNTKVFTQVDVLHSQVNFLCVGRFVEKKSPLSTIKAFKIASQSFPEAKLWMVGDGPLLEEAKAFVRSQDLVDKVIFAGVLPQAEIILLMQKMRAYVQHSVIATDGDMEGTPNTILEASAAGLPIVSTRHAGIKEAVIDEVTGFLVNEHDVQGMASAMIKLAESAKLASDLGSNARQHVLKNYNLETQIGKLQRIIDESCLVKK